jgi:orotate phosphoribosyltransferase
MGLARSGARRQISHDKPLPLGYLHHRSSRRVETGTMLQAVATPKPLASERARLLEIIRKKSLLKGRFKLASGAMSDYYLDLKPTTFDPEGAALLAEIICDMLRDDSDVESIGGLELGAVPIVAAVCACSARHRPVLGFVVRKARKGHGTDNRIDGNFRAKSTVVLFDDVTTTGGSVMQAVRAVREQGATVKKIITVVDRLEGAAANLAREGIDLVPIFTTKDLLD